MINMRKMLFEESTGKSVKDKLRLHLMAKTSFDNYDANWVKNRKMILGQDGDLRAVLFQLHLNSLNPPLFSTQNICLLSSSKYKNAEAFAKD